MDAYEIALKPPPSWKNFSPEVIAVMHSTIRALDCDRISPPASDLANVYRASPETSRVVFFIYRPFYSPDKPFRLPSIIKQNLLGPQWKQYDDPQLEKIPGVHVIYYPLLYIREENLSGRQWHEPLNFFSALWLQEIGRMYQKHNPVVWVTHNQASESALKMYGHTGHMPLVKEMQFSSKGFSAVDSEMCALEKKRRNAKSKAPTKLGSPKFNPIAWKAALGF